MNLSVLHLEKNIVVFYIQLDIIISMIFRFRFRFIRFIFINIKV